MKGLKFLVLLAIVATLVISKPLEACGPTRCAMAPSSSGLCVDGVDSGCDAWCQTASGCSRFNDICGTCEGVKCVCRGQFIF
jgi:hypothetical protein